jgi:sugar phosphate isomerase/epimerase
MPHTPVVPSPSRRRFLQALTATSAVTVAGVASSAARVRGAAGPEAASHLKVGAVTYNIAKDWDVDTIIRNFSAAGIEAVELRTTHAHGVEIALSPAARRDVKTRFEASPVRLASLGTTCEYHAADPAVLARQIEETKAWLQLARDVGAASVKVRPNGLRKDVPEEQTLEQIGRALAECSRSAADLGVKIQLEVHGPETAHVPRIHRILQHAGEPPALWVCWNSNQEDLQDGGLEANFKLVQHRIGQVHMRDLYIEEYPWRQLVSLLEGISFGGYCYAELGESSCDGVRVLKYFRGMLRSLEG